MTNTETSITDQARLETECEALLAETNAKMNKLIEDFNKNQEDKFKEDAAYCDTVDLEGKFDELAEYVQDYTD